MREKTEGWEDRCKTIYLSTPLPKAQCWNPRGRKNTQANELQMQIHKKYKYRHIQIQVKKPI